MTKWIAQAILRHVLQAAGAALVTAGIVTQAQWDSIVPVLLQIALGLALSAFSAWWAARGQTAKSLTEATVQQPGVDAVVVNDPKLAANVGVPAVVLRGTDIPANPTENVYGKDMSIQ